MIAINCQIRAKNTGRAEVGQDSKKRIIPEQMAS